MIKIYKDSSEKVFMVNVVSSFDVPSDWTHICDNPESLPLSKFFDAWKDNGNGTVGIDLPTARQIKLDEIRAKRDAMLKKTDERFVEELSKAADTSSIEADKQALRDITTQAETDLASKIKDTTIDAYDAFASLTLSESYE